MFKSKVIQVSESLKKDNTLTPIFVYFPQDAKEARPYQLHWGRLFVNTDLHYVRNLNQGEGKSHKKPITSIKEIKANLYMYKEGKLQRTTLPEIKEINEDEELQLEVINPIYFDILNNLDSEVKAIFFSDPHGAADKIFTSLNLFPKADVISGGDLFDRSPKDHKKMPEKFQKNHQHALLNLFQTFLLKQGGNDVLESVDNENFKTTMGNHDAMALGAGIGDITVFTHFMRFALRYNEADYFTDKLGIDLNDAINMAVSRDYLGNYKASGENELNGKDVNRALEALFTDLQLKLTYGDTNVTLTEAEANFLHNLKEVGDKRDISSDPLLVEMQRKIDNGAKFIDAEHEKIKHIKKGNNNITDKEYKIMKDIQKQLLKSHEFRKVVFSGRQFKTYTAKTIADRIFLTVHSNIPMDETGNFREVELDGQKYKGIALLDAIEAKKSELYDAYENLDITDDKAIDTFLATENKFFNWIGCSYDSPSYGKVYKTFERAYLPKSTGAYTEPKDHWYDYMQNQDADPAIIEARMNELKNELNISEGKLTIVNGHVPDKKNGLVTMFHSGSSVRIDAGFSPAYNDLGTIMLATEKGSLYSLSISAKDDIIVKYTMHKINESGKPEKI